MAKPEYVDSQPLVEWARGRSPEAVVAAVADVADALQVCLPLLTSAQITDELVRVGRDGRPFLAGLVGNDSQRVPTRPTSDEVRFLLHCSPELLVPGGEQRSAVAPALVYGLGSILYGAWTGSPPAKATTFAQLFRRAVSERPASIEQLVGAQLEAVVRRALSKAPEARYATPADFAADLRAALAHVPASSDSRQAVALGS